MLRTLLLVTILMGLSSCASTGDTLLPKPGYDTISISVGPCYGRCPIYDLVIASDGRVRFQSGDYQGPRRLRSRVAGVERYQAVADALTRYRPPNDLPECWETETDAQGYKVIWTDSLGTSATLDHYSGDTCPASEELTRVLMTIPTLSGVSDWLREPS